MAKTVAFQNSFTAGEIGPDAEDRSDLAQHARGCAEALNMHPREVGPLASRGGFLDRGAGIAQDKRNQLVAFVRSSEDALLLELGENKMRVWTTAGDPVLASGVPYELATPWTAAQVAKLWFKQEGDVLFVTDRDGGPTRVIRRSSDTSWTIDLFDFRDGPWLTEAVASGVTLQASSETGSITLTASSGVWTADDVGSLVQLRESDGSPGLQTWTSETDYTGGQLIQFDGRVYRRVDGGEDTSGTTPPLHTEGTVSDGAVGWTFVHDGRGVARITSISSATVASATVLRPMPTTGVTKFWSKQAYSAAEGYPRALAAEREERLVFAASLTRPGQVDATRTAGYGPTYGDFRPGLGTGRVVEDDAVRLTAAGAERVVWLISATVLIAGCTGGEYALSGSQLDEPMTPDTRRASPISKYGNADVEPLLISGPPPALLHVTRSRKDLRETLVSPDLSVRSRSLSVLAHHIYERGVAQMAWQKSEKRVWLRLDDGGLACASYDSDLVLEQQIAGATRQPLPQGWTVESIACAPAPGGRDVLMATVVRTKGDAPQRRVWLLSDRSAGIFVDGALTYTGAPTTTVNGAGIYAGETVAIVADGARVPDRAVSDAGVLTLPNAASHVVMGQKMKRRFVSLPLDTEGTGSTNGRALTPTAATIIATAADVLVGTDQADSAKRVMSRAPADQASPVQKRMREKVSIGNGVGRDARIVIETDAPFDLVIHAYRLWAEANP